MTPRDTSTSLPLVSIMMATYNRGTFLGKAIESVLTQTYQNWELIVLDDGSTDNTTEIVRAFTSYDPRIIYSRSPQNLGITANRNRGFHYAKGQYIAVLDSDDIWHDGDKLGDQVAFLESNPDHVLVGTQVRVIDGEGIPVGNFRYAENDVDIRSRLLLKNQFTHSSILMRRDILPNPLYNPEVPIWEDYDLILRLGQKGKLANLSEEMTDYRIHNQAITHTTKLNGACIHREIIHNYRKKYPNYVLALIKAYFRNIKSIFC